MRVMSHELVLFFFFVYWQFANRLGQYCHLLYLFKYTSVLGKILLMPKSVSGKKLFITIKKLIQFKWMFFTKARRHISFVFLTWGHTVEFRVWPHMQLKGYGLRDMPSGLQYSDRPFTLFLLFAHTRSLSIVAAVNCNPLQTIVLCLAVFSLFCYMSPIRNQIELCEWRKKEWNGGCWSLSGLSICELISWCSFRLSESFKTRPLSPDSVVNRSEITDLLTQTHLGHVQFFCRQGNVDFM